MMKRQEKKEEKDIGRRWKDVAAEEEGGGNEGKGDAGGEKYENK
jgi:hypothetical protein